MNYTYYGHSCFSIEVKGKHILFDPFITYNELAKEVKIETIEADYIFISHGHQDHLADAIAIAQRTGATCVANFEVTNWLTKNGVEKTLPMNQGGPILFEFGTVRGTNAIHSSGLPDGSYGGNPLGFLFTSEEANFYYAGDTALTIDMQLLPLWAHINFAILPIGGHFTMDTADAVKAAEFIKTNTVIGVHFNTFGFIKIDEIQAFQLFTNAGKTLLLPKIGETIKL
jgi:L-ascorbate metabolism protein UlaG (beta-lactamase superfamily)